MKDIVREEQNLADVTHKKHFGNSQILICDILIKQILKFSYSQILIHYDNTENSR